MQLSPRLPSVGHTAGVLPWCAHYGSHSNSNTACAAGRRMAARRAHSDTSMRSRQTGDVCWHLRVRSFCRTCRTSSSSCSSTQASQLSATRSPLHALSFSKPCFCCRVLQHAGHRQAAAHEQGGQSSLQAVGDELPAPQPAPDSAAKGQRGATSKPGTACCRASAGVARARTPACDMNC